MKSYFVKAININSIVPLNYLITHSCLRQGGGFLLALLATEIKLTAAT
jgi:hypothetical protein